MGLQRGVGNLCMGPGASKIHQLKLKLIKNYICTYNCDAISAPKFCYFMLPRLLSSRPSLSSNL